MNRKFTPTALALVLSTSAIVVDSNSISTVGDANSSSDRLKVDGIAAADVINQYRRKATTEEEQKLSPDNTLDDGTISTDGNGSNTDAIEVDVGILFRRHHVSGGGSSSSTIPRFLQEAAAEEAPTCAYPETCEPNLCACSAKGGYAYDCAAELHAVCKKVYDADGTIWTLDGCVGDVSYYAKVYCPFAKCIVEGGSYATCSCQMYQTVCDLYGDLDKYKDEPNTIQACAAALCCQAQVNDDGRLSCFDSTQSSTTTSGGEEVTDSTPIAAQSTSGGVQNLLSWNNLATSSLTATAVAWSILC